MRKYSFEIGSVVVLLVLVTGAFFYKTTPSMAEFGGVSLRIDYETTNAGRELGLGGRASIPEDYGMLFVYTQDGRYGFWMKDMLVPIDMFWLDSKGQVVFMEENVEPATFPNVFYPSEPARYVFETAAGFAKAHGIHKGSQLLLKNSSFVLK